MLLCQIPSAAIRKRRAIIRVLPSLEKEDMDKYTDELVKKAKVSMKGLSRSSLHAKLMEVDQNRCLSAHLISIHAHRT